MVQLHIEFGALFGVAVVAVAVRPIWARILAQPPPEPKVLMGTNGLFDQRTVKASGQLGAKDPA